MPRACIEPGCRNLTDTARCPTHTRDAGRYRGTAAARGYDAKWRIFRTWFIRRHPLCEDCLAEGITTQRTEHVHHVKKLVTHPELRMVEANCRGLCASHHNARTARGE